MAATLGSLPVESIVKLQVNGKVWDFIVAHHGKPSAIYDDSFNGGTILLMKDLYESRQWHTSDINDYANSEIHSYLNSTFYNLIDPEIRAQIKQVKIPYRPGSGESSTVSGGANGLMARVFLLGGREVGSSATMGSYNIPADGAALSYFSGIESSGYRTERIAYRNGTAFIWWTRSPLAGNGASGAWVITKEGGASYTGTVTSGCGIRPALVLPSSMLVYDDGLLVNTAPTTPDFCTIPAGPSNTINSGPGGVSITMSWGRSTDAEDNLAGYKLERSLNGGSTWSQIYQSSSRNATDNVPNGTTSVMYRVRAYDYDGLQSNWRTSSQITVINNTAPTAPVITGLAAGQRLGTTGSVSFNPSADTDGDVLTYTLQFASNSAFTADLQQFTGSGSPISFNGVPTNVTRYVRVVASDGKATTASAAIQIKMGDVLEFKSNPINRATMPVSCRVMMDWAVADGASYTLQVCNNANDEFPTWENFTAEFKAGAAHPFTNQSKTNSSWAVGLHVIINAGTATGNIDVRASGFDITVA